MRAAKCARWASCALALVICSTASSTATADHKGKSLAECTSFDQVDKGDSSVELTIKNSCAIPVDCAISWRVVCAPDSKKRRAVHAGAAKLALITGGASSAVASAEPCGEDTWSIEAIEWSCQPNKD